MKLMNGGTHPNMQCFVVRLGFGLFFFFSLLGFVYAEVALNPVNVL